MKTKIDKARRMKMSGAFELGEKNAAYAIVSVCRISKKTGKNAIWLDGGGPGCGVEPRTPIMP